MGLDPEDKTALEEVETNSGTPAGSEGSSPAKTLHLISKAESTTLLKTEPMKEAGYPVTLDCDPDSTKLEEVENAVESGGTFLDEAVADRLDAWLKDSERVAIGFRLILVATVVISLAFIAGIWLGRQSARLRRVAPTTRLSMKRATSGVAPKRATPSLSASAAAPENHESISASQQVLLLAVTPEKLSKLPRVNGIRHWSTADSTNIVLDLEDQVQYEVHRLTSPNRIFFDLHHTQLAPDLVTKVIRIGDVSVNRIRIAQPVVGTTRIVLETDGTSDFAARLEPNPSRLVIQVRGIKQISGSGRKRDNLTKPAEIPDALSSKVADTH